jgi:phage tail sheath protein FI
VIPDSEAGPPTRLQDIHVAMLRMASARADMVAVLGMPLSFQGSDATAYRIQLAQRMSAEDNNGRMLSYGALYHPWIVVGDNSKPLPFSLRTLSPEGSVCGLIADKTISAGAWIAPANLPVVSAVALEPPLDDSTALAFAANQINLIAQEPEGFLVTDQNTLIDDLEFQPLNVRRLLILLRRLALREGVRYVFQNISPQFQRSVARQFEQWMQQMLARGAFAGLAAQDSYRVITDATVNPPASIDQGIFVVELRVAPSRPMRFLTVRLVQNGSTQTVGEA